MVHEERKVLEVPPELIDLINGRKNVDRFIDPDAVLAAAQSQETAGIQVGQSAGGQDHAGRAQDRFGNASAGQTIERQQASAHTAQEPRGRRPVALGLTA